MLNGNHVHQHQLIPLIKSCAFFANMSMHEICGLSRFFEKINLQAGDILFRQGESSDDLYILTSGKLVGYLENQVNKDTVIEIINPIETVGEVEVISGEPRNLTVKAVVNAELLKFSGEKFIRLYQKNQYITLELMKLITKRSMETIKLMSHNKPQKFIVIVAAHDNVPLSHFIEKVNQNIANIPVKILPAEISSTDRIKQFIKEKRMFDDGYKIIFLKNYEQQLFEMLAEHDTQFFLLTRTDTVQDEDASVVEILDNVKKYPQFRLSLILLHDDSVVKPINTKFWLQKADFILHHHVKLNNNADYARLLRFASGKATGLVLSGGGMRGFSHLGAIRALLELGINIDIVGGTSVGASVGACYSANLDYATTLEIIRRRAKAVQDSFSLRNITLPLVSLFSGNPATQLARDTFNEMHIEDLWIPFFCISANISNISEVVHRTNSIWEAIRSSNAVPGLLPPVVIDGQLHCDGGILNNLPVDAMRNIMGFGSKIIASQVSRLVKDSTQYCFPPDFSLKETILYKLGFKNRHYKVPPFLETFFKSMLLGSSAREEQNSIAADLLIHPDIYKYPTYTINKSNESKLIEAGYHEAMRQLVNWGH